MQSLIDNIVKAYPQQAIYKILEGNLNRSDARNFTSYLGSCSSIIQDLSVVNLSIIYKLSATTNVFISSIDQNVERLIRFSHLLMIAQEDNNTTQIALDLIICMLELKPASSDIFRVEAKFQQVQYILEDLLKEANFLHMLQQANYQSASRFKIYRQNRQNIKIRIESSNILQEMISIMESINLYLVNCMEVQYLLSFLYNKNKLYRQSSVILRKLLIITSDYQSLFLYWQANCMLQLNHYDLALMHINHAIDIERRQYFNRYDEGLLSRMYVLKGWIYLPLNDQSASKQSFGFSSIGNFDTTNEQAYRNYIQSYLDVKQNQIPFSSFKRQISLLSPDQTLWIRAMQALENQQIDLLHELLKDIDNLGQKYGPKSNIVLHAYLRKAIVLYLMKDFQSSYEFFHKGLSALSWNPYPYYVFAILCFNLHQFQQSVKWLQISIRKTSKRNLYMYRILLAMNYMSLGEFKEAEKIVRYNLRSRQGQLEQPIRKINQIQVIGKLNFRYCAIQAAQSILTRYPDMFMIYYLHLKILIMINYELLGDQTRATSHYCEIYYRVFRQRFTYSAGYLPYYTKQLRALVECGFKYNELQKGKQFLELLYTQSFMTDDEKRLFPTLTINEFRDLEQERYLDYEAVFIHY